MKVIIIDDSSASRTVLKELLKEYFPNNVEIVAVCENGKEGIKAILKHEPDLVFLDVEMPNMTGFEMLKALNFPNINFNIVFSTAHSHYAVQAFRFSAIDFLLKPVAIEEMIEAVMKVRARMLLNQHNIEIEKYKALLDNIQKDEKPNSFDNRRIVLSTAEGTIFLNSDDVIYLEADGNYTTFHCINNRRIIVAKQIRDYDEKPFFRVHKTYCVNPKNVIRITKGEGVKLQMLDSTLVEISRGRKEEVLRFLKTFFVDNQ